MTTVSKEKLEEKFNETVKELENWQRQLATLREQTTNAEENVHRLVGRANTLQELFQELSGDEAEPLILPETEEE